MLSSSQDLFSTSSIQKDAFFVRDWGMATFVEGGTVDPKTRVLHVGIDYTQYVTEDGTELKTKEYGVHEKDTFEGYEFVETHTAANGDTVHVYKKVVTPDPTPEPEQPATPTDPTPTQPETPTNPVEETPAVPTPEPEAPVTPADPTPEAPVEDQPVVPAEPTPEQPDAPVTPEEPSSPTENPGESATPTDPKPESTTETQNSNGNTTEETKNSKKDIIETGARTNMFLSLLMTVIALFAGLFVLKNKKN